MLRCLLVVVALLVCAPAAEAAIPRPTVSIGDASVQPSLLSGSETELAGGPTLIWDGFGLNPPTLVATGGATVTISTDMTVDSVRAWVGPVELSVTKSAERTYIATLPGFVVPPTTLQVGLDVTTVSHRLTSGWTLDLAAPAPAPSEPVIETSLAAPAEASRAVLRGRRLAVTVDCPAASGHCDGTLTLRTPHMLVTRLAFSGIAGGTSRTLRTTVRPDVRRHIERRRLRTLRSSVRRSGLWPVAKWIPLRGV